MERPWLVLVESNTSGTGRLFALKALEIGCEPIVLTDDPTRYPYLTADHISFRQVDTSNIKEMRKRIDELIATAPLAGVFSSSEYFIHSAATLAHQFGLPGNDPAVLERCRNKWRQRLLLEQEGLAVPRFFLATSVEEALKAADISGFPLIVKPVYGTGSICVRLCQSRDELEKHTADLLARNVNERGLPIPKEVLLEEQVPGLEYSVEVFGRTIIGITKKHLSCEPYFVELGHDYPARLATSVITRIEEVVLRALHAIGLHWGPTHIEFRLTPSGPVIIEINPRLAGGFIPELIRLSSGIDLISETLRTAIGKTPHLNPIRQQCASIRFVTSPLSGRISSVCGTDQAGRIPGMIEVQMYRKEGDLVKVHHDFRDRLGHVMACSPSSIEASAAAENARDSIHLDIQE